MKFLNSIDSQKRMIIISIFILLITAAIVDWGRVLYLYGNTIIGVSILSNSLKFCIVFLAATLAFFAKGRGVGIEDERKFRLAFSLILIADICFFIGKVPSIMLGIFVFGLVQMILIRRNLIGLKKIGKLKKIHSLLIFFTAYILFSILAPLNLALLLSLVTNLLTIEILLYSFLLALSVMSALISFCIIKKIPEYNRFLMLIGIIFFFICDLTVMGSLLSYNNGSINVFTSSSTWIFYAPALMLIALSAYKIDQVV